MTQHNTLLPAPRQVEWQEGVCPFCVPTLYLPPALCALKAPLAAQWSALSFVPEDTAVILLHAQPALAAQGYTLTIDSTHAHLHYATAQGALYGLYTLYQLFLQSSTAFPQGRIEDAPALAVRGAMLDISRGKVPTLETLCNIVDKMALFKLNHLQLYLEGHAFAYPSFAQYWQDKTPLTPQDVRQLDAYCKERFIELVPCQNNLGHMAQWLACEAFAALAECPGGWEISGMQLPPTTLDPCNPDSLALAVQLSKELVGCFSSEQYNACMDEPFELGKGKNKGKPVEEIYLEYTGKLHAAVKDMGKKMLVWGDVIGKHPALAQALPSDLAVMDWGYEQEHPVEQRAQVLNAAGLEFYVCPGTNSWSSFTGLTDNMLACIRRSAAAAHTYGAKGMIVTDWGDMGHLQYWPAAYPGLLFAAACAWNKTPPQESELARALDVFVFLDGTGTMGQFCLDAGRYAALEEFSIPCRTLACATLMNGLTTAAQQEERLARLAQSIRFFSPPEVCAAYLQSYEARTPIQAAALQNTFSSLRSRLQQARPACLDAALVVAEYQNALLMLEILTSVRAASAGDTLPPVGLQAQMDTMLAQHTQLWNARNRPHGLAQSEAGFLQIRRQLAQT